MNDKYLRVLSKLNQINTFRPGRLNLENMSKITNLIGNPQNDLKFIHIAGTNGKGTITLKIQKLLQNSGYKTGLYVSPHLFSFTERIMINDDKIDREFVIENLETLYKIAEKNQIPLTFFEYITCLAFLYYRDQRVDFVSLETGLGGRLDATNIVNTKILSIITSIGFDHMSVLGNTLEEIAFEKAGIIKSRVPVVIGPNAVPKWVFQQVAHEKSSELIEIEPKNNMNFIEENNLILRKASEVLMKKYGLLYIKITPNALNKATEAQQKCRMEFIRQNINPLVKVFVDVGHNPNALMNLFKAINFPKEKTIVIFGTSSQKDAYTSLSVIQEHANNIYLVAAQHFRAMNIAQLKDQAENLKEPKNIQVLENGNIERTIEQVIQNQKEECMLIICGSFFIMREVFDTFKIAIDKDPFELNERLDMKK